MAWSQTKATNPVGISGVDGDVDLASPSATAKSALQSGLGASGVGFARQLSSGTFTANGTTAVVVSDANWSPSVCVEISASAPAGTPASPYISAVSNGVSFSVKSGASDTSVYQYRILA